MAKRKAEKKERIEDKFFSLVLFIISVFFLCSTTLTVSSCNTAEESVKQPQKRKQIKKTSKGKSTKKQSNAVPAKTTAAIVEYVYDATGKPDPFLPLITETAPQKREPAQKKTAAITPLQKYTLKELTLVGIISLGDNTSAIIEDPAMFGYIVNDGMLIGNNDGIIKKITGNGIVVEEKVYNSMGELETNIITLTIQHQE